MNNRDAMDARYKQKNAPYSLQQFSWASVYELFEFHEQQLPLAGWGLKGYSHPWILKYGEFSKGQKVLDVGGGYSSLAQVIAERYGPQCWVADDFGVETGEQLWSRWGDRESLKQKYPLINYAFERIGDINSKSFEFGSFDVIYSVSTLEHIPWRSMPAVFDHITMLLKPGGRMLHCVDVPLPLGLHSDSYLGLFLGTIGYATYRKIHEFISTKHRPYLETMKGWFRFIKAYFGPRLKINCSVKTYGYVGSSINPGIVTEPLDILFKYYPPNNKTKRFNTRVATFTFIINKERLT
jgi:SAM-dependent methyltransferase